MTTVADAAAVLHCVACRARGTSRRVAVSHVIAVTGLSAERVESAVEFLAGRKMLTANGTPAASVRITAEGAKMARSG